MKKYTVDSISDGVVILLLHGNENKQLVSHIDDLPKNIREGDIILAKTDHGIVVDATILEKETRKQQANVVDLLEKLKNR